MWHHVYRVADIGIELPGAYMHGSGSVECATVVCRTGRHALSRYLKLACVERGPDEGSSDVRVTVGVFQGIPVKD